MDQKLSETVYVHDLKRLETKAIAVCLNYFYMCFQYFFINLKYYCE